MRVIQGTETYTVIRFEKGERFLEVFHAWIEHQRIQGAFFYGLGGATMVIINSYNLEAKQYTAKEFSGEHFEITNLTGNIAMGEHGPKIHCHLTFSNTALQSFGGHVEELVVGGTLEVYIQYLNPLTRLNDEQVGLALLVSNS